MSGIGPRETNRDVSQAQRSPTEYHAVIFDLGGVVYPSPFEAFDAYDVDAGLPPGTVRALIRASSETGAWASLERGELAMDEFFALLSAEAAAEGFELDGARLMQMIGRGFGPRPSMARAITRIKEAGLRTAALTNNWPRPTDGVAAVNGNGLGFDVVIESAVVGLRKPDTRIYELVLRELDVEATATVFLDDLGINLKPARALGMATIKVTDPDAALAELAATLGIEVH
jgi:putative hydrolase of the HAD superfamily